MPSTWTTPRVWTAGERVGASKMNEISTALGILFPHTTAGDLAYRDAAGAYLTRLAHVAGGIMYGGASIPTWLAKPAANSFLRNGTSGVPDYVAQDNIPGLLHTKNTVDFAPGGQSFSGSWADITGATFNLTLTRTCTILVFATVTGYNATDGAAFHFRSMVDSVADPASVFPFNGGSSAAARNEALSYFYYTTGITAGTRTVKLQCQVASSANIVERGRLTALAFVE